jgi:hypothetical protein
VEILKRPSEDSPLSKHRRIASAQMISRKLSDVRQVDITEVQASLRKAGALV